jgi:hypothetical protein
MDIAFGNNGKTCDFQNVINYKRDNWVTFPFWANIPLDSIDCVYLKVSGSFKVTVIQIDYLIFVDPSDGFVFAVIDDFEDATITDVEKELSIPTSYSLSQNYPNPFNPSTTIKYSIPYVMASLPDEVRLSNHNNTDVIPNLSNHDNANVIPSLSNHDNANVIPSLSNHDNANVIPSLSRDEVHVTLKIYDLLGREVATLVDEYQKPGTYNYQLSTSNYQLSSGVYFYQLQAGNFIATKKLILLK